MLWVNSGMTKLYRWSIHCTNYNCGAYLEKTATEPDYVCQRCGSIAEVSEKTEIKDKKENDVCSN